MSMSLIMFSLIKKDKIIMQNIIFFCRSIKKILQQLLFFCAIFMLFPNFLYAQPDWRLHSNPSQWDYNNNCERDINNNIKLTGVPFEAGPYANTFFGREPRSARGLRGAQKKLKINSAKLSEYGPFNAVFSTLDDPLDVIRTNVASYTFDLRHIAPFVVSDGVVYRSKRTINVNGVRVPDSILKTKPGKIDHFKEVAYLQGYSDKLLLVNGMIHNKAIGFNLWLPVSGYQDVDEKTFTNWKGNKYLVDYAFRLFKEYCLVHYFPTNPSDVLSDGKVKVDKTWIQGIKDSDNRWRFTFLVKGG